ncbi:MAG: mechanosensitive ion channel family protein [Acidimicrobiia bacterium]|nr:mechanosensitive ion channel family protein [Acidimicrobiia bacterium]NNF09126.1 mechanosensitive ion channel family protein [Acidimicrobiia bacterium]NNL70473.1 mechanosensitive ion channel family protein [Acidimicrobiia bacterium]
MLTIIGATLEDACGDDPGFLCETVFDVTDSEFLAELAEFLLHPAKVLLILLAAWIIVRVVRRLIDRGIDSLIDRQLDQDVEAAAAVDDPEDADPNRLEALAVRAMRKAERTAIQAERARRRSETLGLVLKSIAALTIYTIAAFMAIAEFGVNLGPLIASAGIVGIALGFGAQSLVKDFLSGIFMLIEDQFGVGDVIDVGDAAGVVEAVSLRTTLIRDVHGTLWHVPNGEIARVANKSQEWARAVLDIEVAYDTDLQHAMTVIKRVADAVWREAPPNATILEEPEIWGVENFAASAIAIRLAVKVEPGEQWATSREIRRRLKAAFDEERIEIPFPQRTVWVHEVTEEPAKPSHTSEADLQFQPKAAPEGG